MSWTLILTLYFMGTYTDHTSHLVVPNIPTYEACVEAQQKHLQQLDMNQHEVASTCIQTVTK